MAEILDKWNVNSSEQHWRHDPQFDDLCWYGVKQDDGWYWYTRLHAQPGNGVKMSSNVGPFTNWMAAAADCEVAHRRDEIAT